MAWFPNAGARFIRSLGLARDFGVVFLVAQNVRSSTRWSAAGAAKRLIDVLFF